MVCRIRVGSTTKFPETRSPSSTPQQNETLLIPVQHWDYKADMTVRRTQEATGAFLRFLILGSSGQTLQSASASASAQRTAPSLKLHRFSCICLLSLLNCLIASSCRFNAAADVTVVTWIRSDASPEVLFCPQIARSTKTSLVMFFTNVHGCLNRKASGCDAEYMNLKCEEPNPPREAARGGAERFPFSFITPT